MQSSDNSLKDILEKERLEKIWLDDNNILVYTKKENDIIVSIFYASVAGTIASVHEQYLKTISIEEYQEKDTYIRISEDNKLIAFIEKENNNLYLEKIYSIDEHNYYLEKEKDIVFEKNFNDKNVQFIRHLEVPIYVQYKNRKN